MIQSMTGYGKSVLQLPSKKVTVELKSLNSKNLDMNTRMPSYYKEKELPLRTMVAKALSRGKVDVSLYVEITGEETSTTINTVIVKGYIDQLKKISTNGSDIDFLNMAMQLPDATRVEREEINESEWQAIESHVKMALEAIQNYRKDEGAALAKDFEMRVANIQSLLEQTIAIDPERMAAVKERLQKAVSDLKEAVDENRFEQELIYYLEKYDINEEVVRLQNHLNYFISTLKTPESNGKKLGFIAQEMGREINTIGSKSNYAPMQKIVVQMKDELEKVKEQMLNVL